MNHAAVSFVNLTIFLVLFGFWLELFVDLPDWWYTLRLSPWLLRQFLLSIRWCFRKTRAAFLWIWQSLWHSPYKHLFIDKYRLAKWALYKELSKHFLHFYVIEAPDLVTLHIRVEPRRVYLARLLSLCLHYFKGFFYCLGFPFIFFYKRLYDNPLITFLLDRPRPLSFLQFTLMLSVLACLSLMALRLCYLSYSNFFALLAFFGVTLAFYSDFIFALVSSILLFFFFVFLEVIARLSYVGFLRFFHLSRSDISFGLFFLPFFFFFFILFWLFVLSFSIVPSLVGFNFYCLCVFFLFDFFFYYVYKILWWESQDSKKAF